MFEKFAGRTEKLFTNLLVSAALIVIGIELIALFYNLIITLLSADFYANLGTKGYRPFAAFILIFFNVLIGLEMIETIRVSETKITNRAKLILLIGLIAVSRKILTVDIHHAEINEMLGIAALVGSLSLGYFFISRYGDK